MENYKPIYRMYCLVLRQLSGINKGIQAFHAGLEYANKFHNEIDFQKYITDDKTLIILDAGIYQDLVEIKKTLEAARINHTTFTEPDLNDTLTAICFLADDRVWNSEVCPSLENFIKLYDMESESDESSVRTVADLYEQWIDMIGGPENEIIQNIIKDKKLSM
jgi:hypothetical protein